jgi:thermostable 8-oxoguanine DNA glycosylase
MQIAYWEDEHINVKIEIPSEREEVMPGVLWGPVSGFGSPAYWKYLTLVRRFQDKEIDYKLGRTLLEETAACVLGGHGIPADMGLAAYQHIKQKGAFDEAIPSEADLFAWLSEPIDYRGKKAHYRFVKQKACYLAAALEAVSSTDTSNLSSLELRNWLVGIKGIGYKTASWIVRNWTDSDEVAILDIHILRGGKIANLFPSNLKVERHYLELESQLVDFSKGVNIRLSELDAIIWFEMMSAPNLVRHIMDKARLQ